jgi:nitrite reductase/ring-hydroxylating ferredoxin subunit
MVWHKVATSAAEISWQENRMCIVEAGGKKITLGLVNGQVYAFAHKCPHASGIMADGYLNAAGQVSCPLHRYRFDLKNGRNSSGEGYFLKTYSVEIREEGVFVGWEDRGFWASL